MVVVDALMVVRNSAVPHYHSMVIFFHNRSAAASATCKSANVTLRPETCERNARRDIAGDTNKMTVHERTRAYVQERARAVDRQ